MQIVINIDEVVYTEIKKGLCGKFPMWSLVETAIINGTPLPKGHGELIDKNVLYERFSKLEAIALAQVEKYLGADDSDQLSWSEWRKWSAILQERSAYKFDIADAKAIIEADKAEQEAPTR